MRLVLVQPPLSVRPEHDNWALVERALATSAVDCGAGDLLVLPERVHLDPDPAGYERKARQLARARGCYLVAGSQHRSDGQRMVHRGVLVAPSGELIGSYDKLRPYADERNFVQPGETLGNFVIEGRRVLVLICADFWFSDLVLASAQQPDLIVVPALSVSRKSSPAYSQSLWRHLCVTRAYELGTYVGVSDWAHASELPGLSASGVGGFADPTQSDAERLFLSLGENAAAAFELDFDALDAFRTDRQSRGFFWKARSDTTR